jgi:hypothetical protein
MKHSYNFSKLLNHIKDNQIFYKTYFKLNFDLMDDNFLIDKNEFIKWYGTDKMGEYHVVFFKAGFNAIVKKWINGGCKESPEEIEEVIKSEYKKRIE